MATDLKGKTVGNYQILEELGRGGMAVVYRAYQPSLNRYVAIKVLPPELALDREFVERFLREARAAASLRHPHIIVVHDVGEERGLYYIVMEYLEGQTLKQLIEREGPLAPARAARILDQAASALDYAHSQGFVHRDVKPANIFVGRGDHVTLTDFGIAKAAWAAQHLTRTGMLVGTPEYMSPEQAEGGDVDSRTDLYALGVVLYQMLTGRVPFRGTTPHAVLHAVIYEPPPLPRKLNPRLSPAVEAIVLKAMAKQPQQRYQRGAELSRALQAVLSAEPQQAAASPVEHRGPKPAAVRKARPSARPSVLPWILAGVAALMVLSLAALLAVAVRGRGRGTPTEAMTQVIALASATPSSASASASPEPTSTSPATAPSSAVSTEVPTRTLAPASSTPRPPTHTPTLTRTPTRTPTGTPTSTPTPTPTPPPPPPPCAVSARGLFAGLWQSYRQRLGCPLYADPRPIQDAEQAFQNGHMFWRADTDQAYVVYEGGSRAGTYQVFADMWSEGDPTYSCSASPPAGMVQPERGFGAVWCSLGGEAAPIGWGLGKEAGFGPGYGDPLVQDFERGVILRDSDGRASGQAYLFFEDGTFKRLGY